MSHNNNQAELACQYRNADNLNARIALHQRFSINTYSWTDWVFDQFSLPAECRLLELGCGSGNLWQANRRRIPAGWRLVLTDASVGILETTRTNLGDLPQVEVMTQVDAQVIPYADSTFDAVVANHMLYHVLNLDTSLSEIRRVMKPGGTLYAATNGKRHMQEYFDVSVRFSTRTTTRLDREGIREQFSLENGLLRLAPWFDNIQLSRYDDALHVTEVEPLVAYVQSAATSDEPVLSGEGLAQFCAYIAEQIAMYGFFFITKDSGIFIASN